MIAKQLSVFIENRQGRLGDVLSVLKKKDVNILSLSLADTTEYGLLRLIVSDAKTGKDALSENGFSTMLTDVLVVQISHEAGSLEKLLDCLTKSNINVEYMYGLSIKDVNAFIVIKTSNLSATEKVLSGINVKTLSNEDIAKL